MKKIQLAPRLKGILRRLVKRPKTAQSLAQRGQIILLLSQGYPPAQIARKWGITRPPIYKWAQRWENSASQLTSFLEEGVDEKTLQQVLIVLLSDAPRSGKPADFEAEVIAQLIALACESPLDSGYPLRHWSAKELRQELIKRNIVSEISVRSIGRFLKGSLSQTPSYRLLAQSGH